MALRIAAILRRSASGTPAGTDLATVAGLTLAVTDPAGRQQVSVAFGVDGARVADGPAAGAVVVVAIDKDGDICGTDGDLPPALGRVLQPELPHWRTAADRFWSVTGADPGMPATLTVVAEGDGKAVLGQGAPDYTIVGAGPALARVLTGRTLLLDALKHGSVTVRGTFPQLSVMVGASWKARWNA